MERYHPIGSGTPEMAHDAAGNIELSDDWHNLKVNQNQVMFKNHSIHSQIDI